MIDDEYYMRAALVEAERALEKMKFQLGLSLFAMIKL